MSADKNLKEIVDILIHSEDYRKVYDNIHKLHKVCASLTGIVAGDVTDKDIFLESGKAISPIKAAHCLLEIDRTRRFVRGIYKAVLELKKRFNGPINILYAGTGPYATLVLPLTELFSSSEIKLYLLDINPDSLAAVKTLFKELDLMPYVAEFILADATVYSPPQNIAMHLMLSETMQSALKKEPQVAIMHNLIPKLPERGVFIPQSIKIDARLLNTSIEFQRFFDPDIAAERMLLGTVYEIGQHNPNPEFHSVIKVPAEVDKYNELALFTDITVFNDEILTDYNCSLNLPEKICDADKSKGKTVSFKYVMGKHPHFEHHIA
jgi:predicted RNA methylase